MGRYEAVPGRSQVVINASSSVHPIRVQTAVDGWLEIELDRDGRPVADAPVQGEVTAHVAGLRSGNPLVDRETRRRLDPRRHPRIVGSLHALTSARPPGMYGARGTIAFYGSTQEVTGDLAIEVKHDEVAVQGQQRFDVRDWGLQPPQLLLLRVHAEIEVHLRMVLRLSG